MNDYDQDHLDVLDGFQPRALSEDATQRILDAVQDQGIGRDQQPNKRSIPIWRYLVPLAAAACVGIVFFMPSLLQDSNPKVTPNPVWIVTAANNTNFVWTGPNQIRLETGEIHIQSIPTAVKPPTSLLVETPAGQVRATSSDCFVGTHPTSLTTNTKGNPKMKRYLTRSLILAGTVTLTNALGSITGDQNQVLAMEVDQKPVAVTVQANSDFAIDLYRQIARDHGGNNLIFSPFSISSTLTMVLDGARGKTAEQIGDVLRLPDLAKRVGPNAQQIPWRTSMIHTGLSQINDTLMGDRSTEEAKFREHIRELEAKLVAKNREIKAAKQAGKDFKEIYRLEDDTRLIAHRINSLRQKISGVQINVANAIWGEKTYDFNVDYTNRINAYYKTGGVFQADFANRPGEERGRINKWVAEQTNDRITDLLPEGSLDATTRMILVNAIHFKGDWTTPFQIERTRAAAFHLPNGKAVQTATMHANKYEDSRYGAFNADGSAFASFSRINEFKNPGDDGFHVLTLPYRGGTTSMMLIAPQSVDGLAGIEKLLSAKRINAWSDQLKGVKTNIVLPKFKVRSTVDLNGHLQQLGMNAAFSDGEADLSGIGASRSDEDRLYLQQAVHQAIIEVNEKGTEAAAATGTIVAQSLEKVAEFRADRPFLFLIRDDQTGTILFMGRITNPAELK